jgi:hypothetical protein
LPPASITLHRGGSVSAVAECLAGYMREGFATEALSSSMSTINPAILA